MEYIVTNCRSEEKIFGNRMPNDPLQKELDAGVKRGWRLHTSTAHEGKGMRVIYTLIWEKD